MIEKWVSIDVVDSEVRQRLKTYNEQGRIDPDDVIQNTRKALKAIGTADMYDDKWACVNIKRHTGKIPSDIYKVILSYKVEDKNVLSTSNIFKIVSNTATTTTVDNSTCSPVTTTTTTTTTTNSQEDCVETVVVNPRVSFTELVQVIEVSTPMYYGGSDLELLYNSSDNTFIGNCSSYIIRGGRVTTSFQDGTMLINYLGEAQDENGIPLVPDDEDVINALVAFNIYRVIEEDFYNHVDGINPIYAEVKQNWENFRAMAQNVSKLITIPEAYSKVVDNSGRYHRFRLKQAYPFNYFN